MTPAAHPASPASEDRGAGRRARQVMLAGVTVLVLAGCGLLGTAPERESEWAKDPQSGKFFRPGVVLPSQDLLEEHFPELDGVQEATLTDGRFTDPDQRMPMPGPDDYWWQAAVSLAEEDAGRLADAAAEGAAEGEAPDGGSSPSPGSLSDQEVREILVPTIEERISPCSSGWIDVGGALAPGGDGHRTAAGDMIQLAALCEDTAELVIAANDM